MKVDDRATWNGISHRVVRVVAVNDGYITIEMNGILYLAYEHELKLLVKHKAKKINNLR